MNEKNWWEENKSTEDSNTSLQESAIIKEKDKKESTLVKFLPMLWWGPMICYFIILIVKDLVF